jgi:hypothetical protein
MASSSPNAGPLKRSVQWIYLLPVALAPTAHILVSAAQRAGLSRTWRRGLFAGVGAATVLAVWQRLVLMDHSGYPGAEGEKEGRYEGQQPHR